MEAGQADLYREVAARGAWQPADLERLKPFFKGRPWPLAPRRLEAILHAWAQSADFGRLLLPALQVYHQVFFHEEEQRIRPALKEALQHARDLSQRLPLADLLEELSQGVRFSPQQLDTPQVILAPSYWSTPLLFYGRVNETSRLFLFGARPASASLVPGEVVPDSLLNSLKALSDATRLRILRYLIAAPQTPAQLSRRLRLRAPTVVHHLSELRLAGLVQLTIDIPERKKGERRYAVRKEAVEQLCALLQDFLSQPDAA
jgi:DNA-binding transcriptional ArsR family regulator